MVEKIVGENVVLVVEADDLLEGSAGGSAQEA